MNCYKGTYIGGNKFITDDNETIIVAMYGRDLDKYKHLIPFNAYILVEGCIIKNLILI